jgi:hypothetical protein
MDQQTKQKIWAEIVEATQKENQNRQPDEYTVQDFISEVMKSGCEIGEDKARDILDGFVRQGKLVSRRAYLPERRSICVLYSPRDDV